MIVRTWQCTTRPGEDARAYFAFLTARVLVSMETLPGFRGAQVLRRDTDSGSVFTVATRWDSLEAIEAFAGPDIGRSKIDPDIRARLSSSDEYAQHHVLVHERLLP